MSTKSKNKSKATTIVPTDSVKPLGYILILDNMTVFGINYPQGTVFSSIEQLEDAVQGAIEAGEFNIGDWDKIDVAPVYQIFPVKFRMSMQHA